MKKKIILTLTLVAMLACMLAICVSAETPSMYIEFGARFEGSDEYVTIYTQNAESSSNPRINLNNDFYMDVDFTQVADKTKITGMDFSVALSHANGVAKNNINRMTSATDKSIYSKCEEIKWFSGGFTTTPSNTFRDWIWLKKFDLGCAVKIDYGFLANTSIEEIVIPASVTHLYNGVFTGCASLKNVVFEGSVASVGLQQFQNCTALVSVDLGQIQQLSNKMFAGCTSLTSITIPGTVKTVNDTVFDGCTALASVTIEDGVTVIGASMFSNCTALTSVSIPSTVTEIKGYAFNSCTAMKSITLPEGVKTLGHMVFYKCGITSLHFPASVESTGYQVAESSAITTITFAPGSKMKTMSHRAFMSCTSLKGTVILPEGLETIGYGMFSGSTVQAVYIPDTVTTIGDSAMFSQCKQLEFVRFSNQLTYIPNSMFEGCKSLKAISFPDSITHINYKALRSCTSLQAVYLPAGLEILGKENYDGNDGGAFYQSPNVYFVNEPFDVFNGTQLLGASFVMPEKPQVYCMPQNLRILGSSEFQGCNKINDVVVFPAGVTNIANPKTSQGAFFGVGSGRTTSVSLVFLGNMDEIIIRQNDSSYFNVNFVFVNPADLDLNSVTFTVGAANNKSQQNSYAYFCNSNTVYDMSSFVAKNSTTHTILETDYTKTVNSPENQLHFANPKAAGVTEATCTTNRFLANKCFCGAVMDKVEEENTALGHSNTIFTGLFYENYMEKGYRGYKCDRCGELNKDEKIDALFTCLGYSAPEDGRGGIAIGFTVNNVAIKEYTEATGKTLKYGVFAVLQSKLKDKDVFAEDGTIAEGAINADITSYELALFELKIVGFTDEYKDIKLAMGAYVAVTDGETTEYSYLQSGTPNENEKYCFVSYNDIVNAPSTDEEVTQ